MAVTGAGLSPYPPAGSERKHWNGAAWGQERRRSKDAKDRPGGERSEQEAFMRTQREASSRATDCRCIALCPRKAHIQDKLQQIQGVPT